ncbi:MAG: PqqD family peptide modification chaperone [Nitrospiraceae bacterium]
MAAKEQVSCDLGEDVAILNLKNGVYYGLDPVGAMIWKLIQEPRTLTQLRDVLVTEYDVDLDRCEHDLVALLRTLAAQGLIETKDEPHT